MTGTRDKLRSLILVTLMVLSVFAGTVAFSGSVAAAHNSGNGIFDNRGAVADAESPLDANVTVTSATTFQNITLDFSSATNGNGDDFDGNFSFVTDGNVVIRIYSGGTEVARYQDDAVVKSRSNGDETITVGLTDAVGTESLASGDQIYVEFTDDFVNPSNSGLYETPTFTFVNGDTYNGHLNVAAPGAGPGGEDEVTVNNPNRTVRNGTLQYCGQILKNTSAGASHTWEEGETVQVQEQDSSGSWTTVSTTSAKGSTAPNPSVVVDTGDLGLGPGDYRLRGELNPTEGDTEREIVEFELICQDLSADFDDQTVKPGASTTLNISSQKRSSFTVHITSPDLTDEEVDDIFGAEDGTPQTGDIRDADQGVEVDITGNERAVPVTMDVALGNYTFNVDVNDTNATASDFIVVSTAPKDAQLEQDFVEVPRGDLAVYTFSLENTDQATMHLGSDEAGYRVTVTLTDGNEDGTVTVVQNTYLTGRFANDESDAWAAVSSGDSVTANLRTDELDRIVDPAEYDISVRTSGAETDLGALVVTEPSTGDIETYISPRADFSDLNSAGAIAAAKNAGSLTEDNEVANGDVVVHQIDASGIYGAIAAQSATGDDALIESGEFQTAVDNNVFGLSMVQQNEDINTHPKELELDESGSALNFITDNENGSLYVVMRTGTSSNDLHLFREEETREDVYRTAGGDNYLNTFAVQGSQIATSGDSVNDTLSVATPFLAFDTVQNGDWAGEIIVWKPDNSAVSGTTNAAPGTDMTIRLRSTDGAGFLKSQPATVGADGTFTADFNFSDTEPVKNFTATTQTGLVGTVTASGILVERPTATVTLNDQTVASADRVQTITVASVSMNYGGFVTIHDSTLADGDAFGSVVGTSSYLEPGSNSDVSVRLGVKNLESSQQVFAMPHRDTDDDGTYDFVGSEGADDGPYTEASSGDPVVSAAQITVSTPTPTPTATPTPDQGTGPTETDTPTATDTPTSGDGPGFGLVAAVVALLAAALIAVRRD